VHLTITTVLAVGLAAVSSRVQADATITEFPTPSAASLPQGIDIGLNGDVWFSENSVGKVAVLRTNHTTSEFPLPNGGQPTIVKVAADGIWFTDGPDHAIGHLNPVTGQIEEFAIPSGVTPIFLEISPDGSKWFSKVNGVGQLSPNGVMTEWDVALEHPDDNIEQISLDPFGKLWFVERNFDGVGAAGTNKVRRLDADTNVISTYLVPTFGGNPAGVHTNSDGTIWVAEYFGNAVALLFPNIAPHSDAVVRPNRAASPTAFTIERPANGSRGTATNTRETASVHSVMPVFTRGWTEFPIPTANAQAEDMRIDDRGLVWFEEDTGKLGVLNPFTATFAEYPIPSPNSGYYTIALNPQEGGLWFTEAGIFAPVPTKIGILTTDD